MNREPNENVPVLPDLLGQVLAGIQLEQEMVIDPKHPMGNIMNCVKERFRELSASDEPLVEIPAHPCVSNSIFLSEHIDFFIIYLLMNYRNAPESCLCDQLIVHLNNCYRCFDFYCQTVRAYYHELNDSREVQKCTHC